LDGPLANRVHYNSNIGVAASQLKWSSARPSAAARLRLQGE